MRISVMWLKKKNACVDGIEWFKAQPERDPIKIIEGFVERQEHLDWGNWLIVKLMTYEQYVSYAVFSAEQVAHLYNKKYPDDKRITKAIEAAKRCIADPSEANKEAAEEAAEEAAWSAAGEAAWAAKAAKAAWSAAWAAAKAAWSAAWAAGEAAGSKMQTKILEYGLGLLQEDGK